MKMPETLKQLYVNDLEKLELNDLGWQPASQGLPCHAAKSKVSIVPILTSCTLSSALI